MKLNAILPIAAIAAALVLNPLLIRADEEDELNEQPAAVQKTAHEQIGSSKIEEVEPTYAAGQHATEVEYGENGKKMAIVIAPDGTLIQKEHRMSPSEAPEAIKAAVQAEYPGAKISHIKEVERKDSTFFEVSVKAGAKTHRLELSATGSALK
jgi:hypothetical protein